MGFLFFVFFFFFSIGKCLITKLHITGIMMWNKYKKSGKILNTNRLHGNKLYNHESINQQFIIINNVCFAVKYSCGIACTLWGGGGHMFQKPS